MIMANDDMSVPRPEAKPQVAEVLALVGEVFGPDALGAYLHGSSVLGGLRPRSDIDILVVSRRPTTLVEKRRFAERLLVLSNPHPPGPRRPIELTIVVQSQVRPWRYPPSFDFQYGDWHRREFECGNLEPWFTTINPDLASLITMVLLANRPLLGPPPAEILDPVPRADYLKAIAGDLDQYLADDLAWDTRNVLLTLARIWSTLATDQIRSKDAAAAWVLAHMPPEHQPVLARARAIYLGEAEERWGDLAAQVRPCADHMIATIKESLAAALAREPGGPVRLLR